MKRNFAIFSVLWPLACGAAPASTSDQEVVISASLLGETESSIPASITVLRDAELAQAGVQHFADVLALVPNLNWSSGSSRSSASGIAVR